MSWKGGTDEVILVCQSVLKAMWSTSILVQDTNRAYFVIYITSGLNHVDFTQVNYPKEKIHGYPSLVLLTQFRTRNKFLSNLLMLFTDRWPWLLQTQQLIVTYWQSSYGHAWLKICSGQGLQGETSKILLLTTNFAIVT